MREKLADLCHRQWSGWMEYLFGKCAFNPNDGTATLPKWAVDRWQRQLSTEYAHLSEEEKNADRDEADRFLTLIKEAHPQADNNASAPCELCSKLPQGEPLGEWLYCPWCGYNFAQRT